MTLKPKWDLYQKWKLAWTDLIVLKSIILGKLINKKESQTLFMVFMASFHFTDIDFDKHSAALRVLYKCDFYGCQISLSVDVGSEYLDLKIIWKELPDRVNIYYVTTLW